MKYRLCVTSSLIVSLILSAAPFVHAEPRMQIPWM